MTSMREERDLPEIVACPNGPLLVRGEVRIVTPDGEPVPRCQVARLMRLTGIDGVVRG